MITTWFAQSLAERMFAGGSTWSNLRVGLGRADLSTLRGNAIVDDLAEISGDGYARAVPTGWGVTVDINGEPTAVLEMPVPAFANTGGSAWPEASCAFLVGTIDGTERLMAVTELSSDIALPASETLELSDLTWPWKGADYGS